MQKLQIKTAAYKNLEQSFQEWLKLLNFEQSTVRYAPIKAREFFYWLEHLPAEDGSKAGQGITEISNITKAVVYNYFEYLKTRQNQRKNGRLSKNYLRSHLTTLKKLARYLRETGRESFEADIQLKGKASNIKAIFSKEEIKELYQACNSDALGIRDKAMLSVYYGCGLRRNEGINLDVEDLHFDRNLLFVRKGKNYKERFVPMSAGVKEDLQNYVDYARTVLIKETTKALFLSSSGNRLTSSSMFERLKQLKEKAGIEKQAGLHTLRHSIATHLLQSGMKLEQIKTFLGHSSLESTQIYTHITNEEC